MPAIDTNVIVRLLTADDTAQAAAALDRLAHGMDFADALHLAKAARGRSAVSVMAP